MPWMDTMAPPCSADRERTASNRTSKESIGSWCFLWKVISSVTAWTRTSSPKLPKRSCKECIKYVNGSTWVPLMTPPCTMICGGICRDSSFAAPLKLSITKAVFRDGSASVAIDHSNTSLENCRKLYVASISGPQALGTRKAFDWPGIIMQTAADKATNRTAAVTTGKLWLSAKREITEWTCSTAAVVKASCLCAVTSSKTHIVAKSMDVGTTSAQHRALANWHTCRAICFAILTWTTLWVPFGLSKALRARFCMDAVCVPNVFDVLWYASCFTLQVPPYLSNPVTGLIILWHFEKMPRKASPKRGCHESGILTWLRHFRWNLEFSNSSVHFETRGEIDNPSPESWAEKHLQSGNHSSSYASSSKEDHTRSGTAPSPSAFAKSWIETRVANDCSGAALSLLDATNLRIEGGVAKHISGTAPSASSLSWMESLCAFPVSLGFNEHDLSWRYSEEKQHSSVLWIWRLPKGRETASNSLVPLPVFFTKSLKVHPHSGSQQVSAFAVASSECAALISPEAPKSDFWQCDAIKSANEIPENMQTETASKKAWPRHCAASRRQSLLVNELHLGPWTSKEAPLPSRDAKSNKQATTNHLCTLQAMIQNYVPRATIWWEHAIVKHVKPWHAEHGYGGTVSELYIIYIYIRIIKID